MNPNDHKKNNKEFEPMKKDIDKNMNESPGPEFIDTLLRQQFGKEVPSETEERMRRRLGSFRDRLDERERRDGRGLIAAMTTLFFGSRRAIVAVGMGLTCIFAAMIMIMNEDVTAPPKVGRTMGVDMKAVSAGIESYVVADLDNESLAEVDFAVEATDENQVSDFKKEEGVAQAILEEDKAGRDTEPKQTVTLDISNRTMDDVAVSAPPNQAKEEALHDVARESLSGSEKIAKSNVAKSPPGLLVQQESPENPAVKDVVGEKVETLEKTQRNLGDLTVTESSEQVFKGTPQDKPQETKGTPVKSVASSSIIKSEEEIKVTETEAFPTRSDKDKADDRLGFSENETRRIKADTTKRSKLVRDSHSPAFGHLLSQAEIDSSYPLLKARTPPVKDLETYSSYGPQTRTTSEGNVFRSKSSTTMPAIANSPSRYRASTSGNKGQPETASSAFSAAPVTKSTNRESQFGIYREEAKVSGSRPARRERGMMQESAPLASGLQQQSPNDQWHMNFRPEKQPKTAKKSSPQTQRNIATFNLPDQRNRMQREESPAVRQNTTEFFAYPPSKNLDQTVESPEPQDFGNRMVPEEANTNLYTGFSNREEDRENPFEPQYANELTYQTGETYDFIKENPFASVQAEPYSTFSVDVDTASYANVRRLLNQNTVPPPDAVRIEEMINYFDYDYSPPIGDTPFAVYADVTQCPWEPRNRLLRVALKGREIDPFDRSPANLVFLIDVSGSMRSQRKLPLLKDTLTMLVDLLTDKDRIAIVAYNGEARVVLPSTSGDQKDILLQAIGTLNAGGSTNGSAGIESAYDMVRQTFIKGGANRVILATDGDFNVGVTDRSNLVKIVEKEARTDIFLTVLGFGAGNFNDGQLEELTNKGNGVFAYIDSIGEAEKVIYEQLTGTLFTIAKDVKIQVEFNPARVDAYRLIGYENRSLAVEDFNNDAKDAGDIGAGLTVTALYEIVPGVAQPDGKVDPHRYQRTIELTDEAYSSELVNVKLRYKEPDENRSRLIERAVHDSGQGIDSTDEDFRFAAAVAAFGMLLRHSSYAGDFTMGDVLKLARSGLADDTKGYRREFLSLVAKAGTMPQYKR